MHLPHWKWSNGPGNCYLMDKNQSYYTFAYGACHIAMHVFLLIIPMLRPHVGRQSSPTCDPKWSWHLECYNPETLNEVNALKCPCVIVSVFWENLTIELYDAFVGLHSFANSFQPFRGERRIDLVKPLDLLFIWFCFSYHKIILFCFRFWKQLNFLFFFFY